MPSTKRILLELLSAVDHRPLTVDQLVSGAAVFDLTANSVRVTLSRLRQAGLVDSFERGSYRLGSAAAALHHYVSSWRRRHLALQPWDQSWLVVASADLPRANRRAWKQLNHVMRFGGFARASAGLFMRPNNLNKLQASTRAKLAEAGLEPLPIMQASSLCGLPSNPAGLWPRAVLEQRYRDHLDAMAKAMERQRCAEPEERARLMFTTGSAVIRDIVLDPLLPDPMIDHALRRDMITAMLDFDAVGRACWQDVMGTELQQAA